MIAKVVSATSEARVAHLDHACVSIPSVNAINYTTRVSEIRESLYLYFITFNNTSKLWAEKKINETFAIKMASFWPISSSDFMRREEKHLMLRSKIYPAHYIIISFSLCWLYLAGSLTCLTRRIPQTPPSHMYSFLKTRFFFFICFFFLPWSRRAWCGWHQAALPHTQTQELFIMPIGSFSLTSVLAA